jgi:hypothetical protein
MDCYIFRFDNVKSKYRRIAPITHSPKLHLTGLPDLDVKLIGKNVGGLIMLGIVPKDSKFRVTALRYDKNIELGIRPVFEIQLTDESMNMWPVLDARWLTDFDSTWTQFYAEVME